jgi:UDP-N-acetylglucosamine 2-epimerase (non-hydrolysing)
MKRKKIVFIFGTRPEAIKLAPLILKINHSDVFDTVICVTGQHREMLDEVLKIFNIKPDYDLNIMKPNQNLSEITIRILEGTKEIFDKEKPDLLIVQGDTTTCFTSTLSAYYSKIKVAHIEAGLRSFNKYSPFPEEINRKLTSHIADIHFAPTEDSKENLLKENINYNTIIVTGNTIIDALLLIKETTNNFNTLSCKELDNIDFSKKIVLITGHRRENFGKGFENICIAIKKLASIYKDVLFVYPVHLNPNVKKPVSSLLDGIDNIKLIKPLSYPLFVLLMEKSYLILTDSGGIQEEAPALGKPVLVMRDVTERQEAIKAGTIRLIGTDINSIVDNVQILLNYKQEYMKMSTSQNPYGDGKASEIIIDYLINNL